MPARQFDGIKNLPDFKNWVPRVGAAYDLFGNGKTGLKGSVGRYMQQDATSFPQTYNPMVQTTSNLSWTDLNKDDIAQGDMGCVYLTPGCEINFGQLSSTFGARRNRNPAPDLARPYQIVYNAGIIHELKPGLGLAANFFRREFHAISYTSSLSIPFSAYTPFAIPDPRNNGESMTVYNVSTAALSAPTNELDVTSANNKTTYNGFDITMNARFRNGAILTGGTSTGRTVQIACDVTDPNNTPLLRSERIRHPDADDRQGVRQLPASVRDSIERGVPELAWRCGCADVRRDRRQLPYASPAWRWDSRR